MDDKFRAKLKDLADKKKWSEFRKTYLEALQELALAWADTKNMVAAALQGYVRNQRDQKRARLRGSQLPAHGTAVTDKGLLELIYESLTRTIGPTGAQILTLQSPTRYLAKDEFQFELKGIYSNFIKPVTVAEAEFRLTDALYDPAAIVSDPNGRNLSTVYNQILNNFVPKYTDADRKVRQERERIRSWLLTEVGDQDSYYKFDYGSTGGGKGDDKEILKSLDVSLVINHEFTRKMSRMEFASQLTQSK